MAQEVYVVMFLKDGYYNVGGLSCDCQVELREVQVELREVFASLEAAREYCENPDNYLGDFEEWFSNKFKPYWDDHEWTYVLLDDGDNAIYF